MVCPERADDEIVDSGVRLVPGVVIAIVLGLEVDQPVWLDTHPLPEGNKGSCGSQGTTTQRACATGQPPTRFEASFESQGTTTQKACAMGQPPTMFG